MQYCLVVDDNDLNREVFIGYIEELGLEVGFARDGDEALESCLERMPDFILLDWHMPGLDGLEFLQTLREMKGGDRPLVVMCTCEDIDTPRTTELLNAGINGFITKPAYFKDVKDQFVELGLIEQIDGK